MKIDALRGQLELAVLAMLREAPLHGYAILRALRERSSGEFDVLEGTLYPALYRLEAAGAVKSRWATASGRRRRVYELTKKGRLTLADQESDWRRFARALDALLGGAR